MSNNTNTNQLSTSERQQLLKAKQLSTIVKNPVLWAKLFVTTINNKTKKPEPWTARWYQAQMLLDKSLKKVARCGRRTGKTETMCIDSLWRTNTKNNYVALFVCPYENQVRLIFTRINELIDESPELTKRVKNRTKNPFVIEFNNHSRIVGFTTGASSGSGAASVRGQRLYIL